MLYNQEQGLFDVLDKTLSGFTTVRETDIQAVSAIALIDPASNGSIRSSCLFLRNIFTNLISGSLFIGGLELQIIASKFYYYLESVCFFNSVLHIVKKI